MIGLLGGMTAELPMIPIFAKQVRLQGCVNGSRQDQIDLVDFLGERAIRPVLDRRFRLEELPGAFRYEEAGSHFGKIVIEWTGEGLVICRSRRSVVSFYSI
jgi:NADPH:quinone reductase-like Zn-dependent oxidoreductase